MAIFAVISNDANPALDAKIISSYAETDRYRLNDRTWLLSADKLARQVSDEMGITIGELGSVVVVGLTPAYFGYHNKTLWEWFALKAQK